MQTLIGNRPLFDLTGKHALVTGGANGLGRMIAEGLMSAGASVTITSRKESDCRRTVEELTAFGNCTGFVADFSNPDAVVELGQHVRAHSGSLDILVNNAGRTWAAPIETFPEKGWTNVMAINVQAPFRLVQEFLPELTAAAAQESPSRVINVGSIAGKVAEPLQAYSYAASKAAVHHLSRQLAADLADRFINVNTVVPGYFATSMTAHLQDDTGAPTGMLAGHIPLGRFGAGSDITGAVVFLCSRAGAYVTGTELIIDGGITGCR